MMNKKNTTVKLYKPASLVNLNTPIPINERRLLNVLLHFTLLSLKNVSNVITDKTTLKISVMKSSFYLILDRESSTFKFPVNTHINSLNKKNISLNGSDIPFIKELLYDKTNVYFKPDPSYNKYLLDNTEFPIDQFYHRNIVNKHTLVLYEFSLQMLYEDLTSKEVIKEQNTVVQFKKKLRELKTVFGMDKYKEYPIYDFWRGVLKQSNKELNAMQVGFALSISYQMFEDEYEIFTFHYTLNRQHYINNLFNIK